MPLVQVPTVSIQSGSAEVVAAGTVIAFGTSWDSWISILLSFPDKTFLTVRFEFHDEDVLRGQPKIEWPLNTKTELTLRLINFNSVVGVGNTTPLRLGDLDGIPFYLNLRVFQLQDGQKTLHYTFYTRDDARVLAARASALKKALSSLPDPPASLPEPPVER